MAKNNSEISSYYATARKEVAPFIPHPKARILEIGCGAGATIGYLKDQGLCSWAAGVEIMPKPAAQAKKVCDQLWLENIEQFTLPIKPGTLDVILCLDVLEHLVDPWAVVKKLTPLLKKDGVLIASIPNIRHHSVLKEIILKGDFKYDDYGILDRTHLRFFTRKTILQLMECSGLKVDRVQNLHYLKLRHWWKPKRAVKMLLHKFFPDFFAIQYLVRARKVG